MKPDRPDWNAIGDGEFRAHIRTYFEANYPSELRYAARRLRWSENGGWYRQMADLGWIAPSWPVEHGGMGLSPSKLLIFYEEQERWGISRFQDHGVQMIGPLLIRLGTDAQREKWLAPILRCEHIWCQGYSEPNAGSDLASLRTSAIKDGNEFVVNGQKIWTTLAQDATHIFVLVRTDPSARKQAGISFLLVDLATPGVRIRPIRDIAGHDELNEVFFDDVRVPLDNLVGDLNGGWQVAKTLLGLERIFLGSPKFPQYALSQLARVARLRGLLTDPHFVRRFADLRMRVEDHAVLYERFVGHVRRGEPLPASVGMLKLCATELFQRIADTVIEMAGELGQFSDDIVIGEGNANILDAFYKARPSTIYGGTSEVQRNILAKAVLGLT